MEFAFNFGGRQFLFHQTIACASTTEVLCQLDISESLNYITPEELNQAEEIATRLTRVMSGLRKSLINKIS
ncbi:MAG: four helix bundle protein [Prevotella sp.]|nr:four helix bundle protein [Prevotella sp.]